MVKPARLLLIIVFCNLWLFGSEAALAVKNPATEGVSLALIVSDNSQEYQSVLDSFVAYLDRHSERQHKITTFSPDDLTSQNDGTYDLFIAIGTPASRAVVSYAGSTPTLCIFIPRKNFIELPIGPQQNIASIVIDQPLSRYLQLSAAIFGADDRKLGVFYNGQQDVRDLLIRELQRNNFIPVLEAIDPPITARNITRLLDGSDVIQLLPGIATIPPQRAKWLLYMAYRERIPVIAFSPSYVRSGALAAISTSPDAIGRQAAEYVARLLATPGPITLPQGDHGRIRYPATFSVHINRKIAARLGINIADPKILEQHIDKAVSDDRDDTAHAD